jgi:hypothetical protein
MAPPAVALTPIGYHDTAGRDSSQKRAKAGKPAGKRCRGELRDGEARRKWDR